MKPTAAENSKIHIEVKVYHPDGRIAGQQCNIIPDVAGPLPAENVRNIFKGMAHNALAMRKEENWDRKTEK